MAQQPVSIHLTEKDGLPDIEFYDIIEDNKGFIWLAADKGLYRYDGKQYKLFTHPEKRGRSLFGLTLDAKGRVWSNNLSGQFFYVENDELILFKDFEDINSLIGFNIFKNHLVFKKGSQVAIIDIETKDEFTYFDDNAQAYLVDLNTDKDGFYFNKNNIIYFSQNISLKKIQAINQVSIAQPDVRGYSKFFDYNNKIFYFNALESTEKNVLYQLTKYQNISYQLPKELESVIIVHTYQIEDRIWVLTNNGIFISRFQNNTLIIDKHYFEGLYITDVLIDQNQNVWVSTFKDGIYIMPNPALKKIILSENFKNIGVTAIEKTEENDLYLSTSKHEIFNYDIASSTLKKLDLKFNNNIYDINYNPFSKDLLMVATTQSLFYNKNKAKNAKSSLVVTKSISVMDADNYLVSQPHTLAIYNKKSDTVTNLRQLRTNGSVLSNKNDKAYANFIDGLGVIDLITKKFEQITYENKPIFGYKIAVTKDDIVWVATEGKGMYGFKNGNLQYKFDKSNGLASNIINVIEPDNNTIWIATDKGLQNYNYKTNEIITLNREDGIDSYNISAIEIVNNELFFGSNTGLYRFDKMDIVKPKKLPIPYFTTVAIQEKDTLLQTNYTLKQIESEIRIGFNVNGFQTNEFVDFEYQLRGYSDNWIPVENGLNFVKFNTLPAGKFMFKVRAKNAFQSTYSKPISLALTIRLPFYKTWWFYFVILLTISIFIWIYFNTKTKRLHASQKLALEKANMNQQLVFSQLENLRSQMNPHFIFNALNSIQDYIILNEKKLARQYLVKFSRLIRTYLEHSQTNEITLYEEIRALKLYLELEKDRFDDDFQFEIHVDKQLNLETTFVPSLFIQPYVENALKHGLLHKKRNKKLQLNFEKDHIHHLLICEIIDNGVGREASSKINKQRTENHKPFATSANQKRIDLLNKIQNKKVVLEVEDVLNESNEDVGTKVTIKIPLTD